MITIKKTKKQYLFNYYEDTEMAINFISAKRALNKIQKPEKLCELLRNLIDEEYIRLNRTKNSK